MRYRVTVLKKLNFVPNADIHGTMGMNDKGEVVYGYDAPGDDPFHGWVWLPVNTPEYGLPQGCHDIADLVPLSPEPPEVNPNRPTSSLIVSSFLRDINESGQAVGQILFDPVGTQPIFDGGEAFMVDLRPPRLLRYLGTLEAGHWTSAHAIDDQDPPNVAGIGTLQGLCSCPYDNEDCQPAPDPTDPKAAVSMRGFRAAVPPIGTIDLECLQAVGVVAWNAFVNDIVSDPSVSDPEIIGLTVGHGQCEPPLLAGGNPLCSKADPCLSHTEAARWVPDVIDASRGERLLPIDDDGHENPPNYTDDNEARADGINNELYVVGMLRKFGGGQGCQRISGLWKPVFDPNSGEFRDHVGPVRLGDTMPSGEGGDESRAFAIADRTYHDVLGTPLGELAVVGMNLDQDTGVLWEMFGVSWIAHNLNELLPECGFTNWKVREAHDINTDHWIACIAAPCGSNDQYAVLLTPVPRCPADVNRNGSVDGDDFVQVVNAANGQGCVEGVICWSDVDLDCDVDIDDVVELILTFSRDCVFFQFNPESHGGVDAVSIDMIFMLFADDPEGLALALEAYAIAQAVEDP